ncbi:hypothetical protein HanPSC8_Chr11g0490481 [Helianthus annuus]|nr:hypothetical protein HanIR_Chr11g0547601 [Helianthus annuus]KAJ0511049.1 hypothetical protein HanIR_Chr11g0547611 [Helianthus annuus]KAJ0876618.1 hypothetical protein HanPSC8_Chr11g0490481 [Helianthus annuus]
MDTNNIMISLGLSVSDHNMFIVHRETTLAVSTLAIDLVDEACANVRVQLDSQPEEKSIILKGNGCSWRLSSML